MYAHRRVCSSRRAQCAPDPQLRTLDRISALVEKLQTLILRRHVDDCAHAKSEQYAALYPGIRLPFTIGISFSRTDFTAIKRGLEFVEDGEVFVGIFATGASLLIVRFVPAWKSEPPAVAGG
jgi:hypothetical protein